MLKTALGKIIVTLNGQKCEYSVTTLVNEEKSFSVDGRYKLTVDIPDNIDVAIVECIIGSDSLESFIESGERLALISFYEGDTKLSIGVEDEIPHVFCKYLDYGLRVIIPENIYLKQVVFGVAWLTIVDTEKEDIYTWFAADPTLFK